MDGIPADFQSQMLWDLLFPELVLLVEKPSMALGPLTPQGEPMQLHISSSSQLPHVGVKPAHFESLPFLPFLTWFLLYSLVRGLLFS